MKALLFIRMSAAPALAPIVALAPTGPSDAELVERVSNGDKWAQEAMYRRYVRLIASVARRMLQPTDVDDVVQETFIIAFEKVGQLVQPSALKGWLLQIAMSRVHRKFRFRRITKLFTGDDGRACLAEQVSAGASPEVIAELALFDRVLGKLPRSVREPWLLRNMVGCSLEEVAAACDCSLATIKRRISDAQGQIDAMLGEGL
jgi:RNA polymerase sigma-70 factor, ECF subfamily